MTDSEKQPEPIAAPDRFAKEIGERIAAARNGLGFSQQALHVRTKLADPEKIGISRAVLSLYETGTNKPGAREIRILCNTLKVSPNWLLYGSESPAPATRSTMDFLRGSDIDISARLAFAMLALDPEYRDSLAQLIFSMLKNKMSDVELSSLMTMANLLSPELMRQIESAVGQEGRNLPIADLIDRFIKEMAGSLYTNYGNLRPAIPDDQVESFDPDNPPPPRKLS